MTQDTKYVSMHVNVADKHVGTKCNMNINCVASTQNSGPRNNLAECMHNACHDLSNSPPFPLFIMHRGGAQGATRECISWHYAWEVKIWCFTTRHPKAEMPAD